MKRMTITFITIALLLSSLPACTCGARASAPQERLKALIVDGQNNHNWEGTTPVLKAILEENDLFSVDVATSPPQGQAMDSFRPEFAKYDVVVSNYTGASWPQATQDALESYIKNGGGLVIFHAADNAFPKWDEWNKMIALGGWGGRNEKSGPMIRYREGKVVRDTSPGPGGTHGPQHAFQVTLRNDDHPITRGLPPKWMHVKDELYSKLRGPAQNMTLLATAYADPAQRGTGEHEPVLFTIDHRKGRIFHTVLGHGPEQLKCVCCIFLLQRGTEWAATGKVTQTTVPDDFPTAEATSIRTSLSADYRAIQSYDFGKTRQHLAAVEAEIRVIPSNLYPQVESKLLSVLESPNASFAARQFVCRMLRRIGSARSVPALAKMLSDRELSHMARFALQHMPASEAGTALRGELATLSGELRVGVIGSLGLRGDAKSVPELAKLVTNHHKATAAAAIKALGRIGVRKAANALAKANVASKLRPARDDAYLMCADFLLAAQRTRRAVAIYKEMSEPANTTWIRIAAYRGLVQAQPNNAIPDVLALLRDDNLHMQRAAGRFIMQMPGENATIALASQLSTLDPAAQVLLISALDTRADRAAVPYVLKAAGHNSEQVRQSALKALGTLGDGSHVSLLTQASIESNNSTKIALNSLRRISGPGVTESLVKRAQSSAPVQERVNVMQVLVDRQEISAVPALCTLAQSTHADIRRGAIKALGALARAQEIPHMIALLLSAKSSAERSAVERALISVIGRQPDTESGAFVRGLAQTNSQTKPNLLAILAVIGDEPALSGVRSQLSNRDDDVKKAAVRALSNWPNDAPLDDLMKIAKDGNDSVLQVLALRGYIKVLARPANRSATQTVAQLEQAMAIAQRPQEKKAVLSALLQYPCAAALDLAQQAVLDTALRDEAMIAVQKIKTVMVSNQLSATASRDAGNAKNALDGNAATRWSTGRAMKPGDWFVLDLGVETTIRGLTLDTKNSPNDYPRAYEVFVSFDGGNWGDPILKDKGTKPITDIAFAQPVRTRFIKILQTGSIETWHWSIHRLNIKFE
jgi:uncharacterized protein